MQHGGEGLSRVAYSDSGVMSEASLPLTARSHRATLRFLACYVRYPRS